MNGAIPGEHVEWRDIRGDRNNKRWAVEARASVFVAHLVAVCEAGAWKAPETPQSALVYWSDADAREAMRWLSAEAEVDSASWGVCVNCGKTMHTNKAPLKEFCSAACRDVAALQE